MCTGVYNGIAGSLFHQIKKLKYLIRFPIRLIRKRKTELLKGKPSERLGRKTTGLSPGQTDKVAGLPGKKKPALCLRRRAFFWSLRLLYDY